MKHYGMQRRVPEPSPRPHVLCYVCYCRTLTYATPSLLLVLLLLLLENRKVILTNFAPSQNSWGPMASTLALWWPKFGRIGICKTTKFVPAKWGTFGDLKA